MVAAGMGVTVIPRLSVPPGGLDAGSRKKSKGSDIFIKYIPFAGDAPTRRVVLVWRRSYTRYEAMAELRNAVMACDLDGVLRPE